METITKQVVNDYEILDDTPQWAINLFDKMKSEICAEVHAKVAYTVRIMLDGLAEEIKTSLTTGVSNAELIIDTCPCRDPRKCRPCNEKRAALRAAHYTQKKEEKKMAKLIYKENKKLIRKSKYLVMKSSGSESETGGSSKKNTEKSSQICLSSQQQVEAPPIPLREINHDDIKPKEINTVVTVEAEPKILNNAVCDRIVFPHEVYRNICNPDSPLNEKLSPMAQSDSFPTVSDSEFEVVSMPKIAAEHVRVTGDDQSPLSDIESNNSSSGDYDCNSEPETECEVNSAISKPDSSYSCIGKVSLYPDLEVNKMNLSMASSTTSTVEDYLYACKLEKESIGAVGGPMERERAPYSGIPEDLERKVDVVPKQPLPSEFSRERHPYSQVTAERTTVENLSGFQQNLESKGPPKQAPRDPRYRVDRLPESLWDEAMTVAAHTYIAAKIAVETLADSFVPGLDTPAKAASPRPPSTAQNVPPATEIPARLTKLERRLYEMGFTDCSLNSSLLARHNYDIEKVVAELIDP